MLDNLHSSPPRIHREPAPSTTADASTATGMPLPCATYSTGLSAASTTACKPARHTTKLRRSPHSQQRQYPLPLDSYQDRRSVDQDRLGCFGLCLLARP